MAYTKAQVKKLAQKTTGGIVKSSVELSASVTSDVIYLDMPAAKISVQSEPTLVGTYQVSLDGITFETPVALGTSGAIVSYSTHVVSVVKLNWTSGTGKVVVGAVP